MSELAWIRIHNCDKLFTDILLGLNPVDKYDMTSEILFLFEVYPEVQELTKYIVLPELECCRKLECQKIDKRKSFPRMSDLNHYSNKDIFLTKVKACHF